MNILSFHKPENYLPSHQKTISNQTPAFTKKDSLPSPKKTLFLHQKRLSPLKKPSFLQGFVRFLSAFRPLFVRF